MNLNVKFGILIPNKVHIIIDYLPVYLSKYSKTLYQIIVTKPWRVSTRSFFKRVAAGNYNVKNFRSKSHGKKLLRGVIQFNSVKFGYGV